jgi:glycerol kinase
MQWLQDTLKLIANANDAEHWARQIKDTEGVYLVPAFTGLGAPYWDPWARGAIVGLTRHTGIAHIIRAALEAVCYQTADLLATMALEGAVIHELRVDGGMTVNTWLLQFLADILPCTIKKPKVIETTALGAAYLAGLQVGIYDNLQTIADLWHEEKTYYPEMTATKREHLYQGWRLAVRRVLTT